MNKYILEVNTQNAGQVESAIRIIKGVNSLTVYEEDIKETKVLDMSPEMLAIILEGNLERYIKKYFYGKYKSNVRKSDASRIIIHSPHVNMHEDGKNITIVSNGKDINILTKPISFSFDEKQLITKGNWVFGDRHVINKLDDTIEIIINKFCVYMEGSVDTRVFLHNNIYYYLENVSVYKGDFLSRDFKVNMNIGLVVERVDTVSLFK